MTSFLVLVLLVSFVGPMMALNCMSALDRLAATCPEAPPRRKLFILRVTARLTLLGFLTTTFLLCAAIWEEVFKTQVLAPLLREKFPFVAVLPWEISALACFAMTEILRAMGPKKTEDSKRRADLSTVSNLATVETTSDVPVERRADLSTVSNLATVEKTSDGRAVPRKPPPRAFRIAFRERVEKTSDGRADPREPPPTLAETLRDVVKAVAILIAILAALWGLAWLWFLCEIMYFHPHIG